MGGVEKMSVSFLFTTPSTLGCCWYPTLPQVRIGVRSRWPETQIIYWNTGKLEIIFFM